MAAARRKTVRKPRRAKKESFLQRNAKVLGILLFVLLIFGTAYHYRNGLAYYFSFKTDKILREEKRLADIRNLDVLSRHEHNVIGIDVSEYQGTIDWSQVDTVAPGREIGFVFIRATAGRDKTDRQFAMNWKKAKENNFIRGAYHYYRPNENSSQQADNFIKTVTLAKGDLPPVLDIEQLPERQSVDSLKVGLRRWLTKVEKHYKVRPIIYSGEKYYDSFLKDEFQGYTFWIANYNFFVENIKDEWEFWQFTEKATVPGIEGKVDMNIYNGTPKMLRYLTKSN